MKEQGDWAFATGINRFVYHTFQSQTLPDNLKPGMKMGPYGVHWDRSQTWWPMVETTTNTYPAASLFYSKALPLRIYCTLRRKVRRMFSGRLLPH